MPSNKPPPQGNRPSRPTQSEAHQPLREAPRERAAPPAAPDFSDARLPHARILVPERLAGHVQKGHPWLYKDVLPPGPPPAKTGDVVTLVNREGRTIGMGLFDSDSPLAIRVLTTRAEPIDLDYFVKRVETAWQLRHDTLELCRTTAFRVLHGEGDRIPGVVVDHYAGYLVMKLDTRAWFPHLPLLVEALNQVIAPEGIYLKGVTGLHREVRGDGKAEIRPGLHNTPVQTPAPATAGSARQPAGSARLSPNQRLYAELRQAEKQPTAPPAIANDVEPMEDVPDDESVARTLSGKDAPPEIEVFEYGMKLAVDVYRGQKTGFFLDQRENRALVSRVAHNREVLNLFSYTGGFSLSAACGGARKVVSVDIAKGAVEGARHNFILNGFDASQHEFVAMDCFEYLSECAKARRQFDLVICDPPSFAPREKAVRKALHAYTRLHEKAIRQVRPGGLLAAASCSSHITMEMFMQTLKEAASEARRPLRLLDTRGEPADHPTPLHFPEGRYLKFVLAVVD